MRHEISQFITVSSAGISGLGEVVCNLVSRKYAPLKEVMATPGDCEDQTRFVCFNTQIPGVICVPYCPRPRRRLSTTGELANGTLAFHPRSLVQASTESMSSPTVHLRRGRCASRVHKASRDRHVYRRVTVRCGDNVEGRSNSQRPAITELAKTGTHSEARRLARRKAHDDNAEGQTIREVSAINVIEVQED